MTVKTKKLTLNDRDREKWVYDNDGWYQRYKHSPKSKGEFVRANRAEIDADIQATVDKPGPGQKGA